MAQDFEDILVQVGNYGKYQKLIIYFVMVPTSFLISASIATLIFQTVVPEHYWCDPPGRALTNFSEEEWWNLTVPRSENGEFEKCLRYQFEILDESHVSINTSATKECTSRWTYDKTIYANTMATSMNWLCDKEIYSTHILSANLAGNAIGTFILPLLADKYTGRRLMFYVSVGIHLFFNSLVLVVPYYSLLVAIRFLGGLSFQTNFQMPYIIGLELTCPDKRALASFFSFVAWTVAMCFMAMIAWLVPNWWYLNMISIIPSILFFGYWRFIPGSPRWLLSKGRIDECINVLLRVAKTNKKKVDRMTLEKELMNLNEDVETASIRAIFMHKTLLFHGTLVTFLSMTVFMAYGCTLVNIKILPDNYYLSYFVLSFSELPSNIMSYLSVHYLGRRFTAIITSILSMVFCFMATFFLDERVVLLIVVSMIKVFVTQNIYVVYVIATEVFPTPVRSIGMGLVIVAGMVGIFFSPYIVAVSGDGAFQYWMMIGLGFGSLLMSLPLPETIGLPLPQTFAEAENVGKGRPFFSWVHHWNKNRYKIVPTQEDAEDKKT